MKKIFANYDDEGIFVYQAFNPSIVQAALKRGTFDKGFNLERMTWIKPSFGWMLYRSGYATKHNQEAILKIKLPHQGFLAILKNSVETSFNPDVYGSSNKHQWRSDLSKSEVRHQWDPDRDLRGKKLERRAIQIGISGEIVKKYVNEWVIKLEEVTELAKLIGKATERKNRTLPSVPEEKEYEVSGLENLGGNF